MKRNIVLIGVLSMFLSGCSLDYDNTAVINPKNVWTDPTMVNAFLTDIYGRMMPGWPISANNTDEGMDQPGEMSGYVRGQISVDNTGLGLDYSNIDRINFFLDQMETVSGCTQEEIDHFRGQALFWRAWDYWGKVWNLGGVPLILHFQDVTDIESLFVTRNSTSECMDQIISDLDEAIALLPDSWSGSNYGRIDKGVAMAFKGRIMMYYASPLFNPTNDQGRWQKAYEANKAAVNFLTNSGKGLYEGDFSDIWFDERNREVIMVNQFYYPDHALAQNSFRPGPFTKDYANQNQAILPLLLAFPRIDGSKLELEVDRLADPEYNAQFMTDFYIGRDPRFYATIFCPGTDYPASDVLKDGMKYWNGWYVSDEGKYISLVYDELEMASIGFSGYYQLKGLDRSLTINTVYNAQTDWVEIRFAEVLMNMAECANEVGNPSEALDVLYRIRKRAGILEGTGNFGIQASSKEDIRQAILDERFIEFAYEGKRWADIRRWKRFDSLNEMRYRSTLYPVIKDHDSISAFDWTASMYDDDVRSLFRFDYIKNVDGDEQYHFDLSLNHWFYPLSKNTLDRNSNLAQNDEWGGNFNPLN